MAAKYQTSVPTNIWNRPMSEAEIEREVDKERQYHRLNRGRSLCMCSCGYSFVDANKSDVKWRHDLHVTVALKAFENKLRGIHEEIY